MFLTCLHNRPSRDKCYRRAGSSEILHKVTTSLVILATIKIAKVLILTDAVSELFDRTNVVSAITCTLIMRLLLITATIMETVFLSEGMVEAGISTSEPNNLSNVLNF